MPNPFAPCVVVALAVGVLPGVDIVGDKPVVTYATDILDVRLVTGGGLYSFQEDYAEVTAGDEDEFATNYVRANLHVVRSLRWFGLDLRGLVGVGYTLKYTYIADEDVSLNGYSGRLGLGANVYSPISIPGGYQVEVEVIPYIEYSSVELDSGANAKHGQVTDQDSAFGGGLMAQAVFTFPVGFQLVFGVEWQVPIRYDFAAAAENFTATYEQGGFFYTIALGWRF